MLPAAAQELSLPAGARLTAEEREDFGSYALPTGPWQSETGLPVRLIEGPLSLQAWRLEGSGLTPLQLLAPLRDQLEMQGFEPVFACADRRCGGFDFRFETRVLPAPEMRVDLTGFEFLSAQRGDGAAVSVLTSRDPGAGYVQIIRVGDAGTTGTAARGAAPRAAFDAQDLASRLERDGHAVLDDLSFATGSSALSDGVVTSLEAIAAYLAEHPDGRVLLVGHTDATGSLEANRALSQRRAEAAAAYLASRHALGADRVLAEGAGFLAPVASNLTVEGRQINRRVEAVLLPSE